MSGEGIHILMVTPGFADGENDSTCIPPLYLFVKELKKQQPGIKISIITLHYPFKKEKYSFSGAQVYPLNGRNRSWIFSSWMLHLRFRSVVSKIHKEFPVSVVHSFWLDQSAYFASRFAKENNISHICTLMGQDATRDGFYGKMAVMINKNITLITLSTFHRKMAEEVRKIKISRVIPWGVDDLTPENFQREVDILGTGSLVEVKHYDRFIDIVSSVRLADKKIKVVVIGKGKQEEELQKKMDINKANIDFEYVGELSRSEVLHYMNRSKVFLHTARYESFGYVLAEALAMGCHVVSTPVGYACDNPEICTFSSNEEAVKLCVELLNTAIPEKINFPVMKDVAERYMNLYVKQKGSSHGL